MTMEAESFLELADRVETGRGCDNALDVLIEVALFSPCAQFASARANSAGSKIIYMSTAGRSSTHWAEEWTADRPGAVALLRRRAEAAARVTDSVTPPDTRENIDGVFVRKDGEVMPAATPTSEAARGARSVVGCGAGPESERESPSTDGGSLTPTETVKTGVSGL
jgi:hypothetical protein